MLEFRLVSAAVVAPVNVERINMATIRIVEANEVVITDAPAGRVVTNVAFNKRIDFSLGSALVRAYRCSAKDSLAPVSRWLRDRSASMVQVTVRARIIPDRALPRRCGTRQKSWLPRRTRWPRTW